MSKSPEFEVDSSLFFAGRKLDFRFSNPSFLNEDREFMTRLEHCRQKGGAAIIYIDTRDDYGTIPGPEDPDAGFHYALLGSMSCYPPQTKKDLEEATKVIPLPIFSHIMGLAAPDEENGYQLTCNFYEVAGFLNGAFEGRVFFASRAMWDAVYNPNTYQREPPTEGYVWQMVGGAPEVRPETIELLGYLGKDLNAVTEDDLLALIEELRPENDIIDEATLLQIMKKITGVWKLGWPPPPRTPEELRNYWLK
jgi:hypothetical protein